MTTTGYEFSYQGETVGLCQTHREELGIRKDDCTEIRTGMFRHGNGGSPCAVCGFDVLDILAPRALRDDKDTTRDSCTVPDDERTPLSLGMCAELISYSKNIDAWPFIDLAPGESPEEDVLAADDEGNAVAKQVSHGDDAVETLYVELDNWDAERTYKQMHEQSAHISNLLESFGLETALRAHPLSGPDEEGSRWHVTGVLSDK